MDFAEIIDSSNTSNSKKKKEEIEMAGVFDDLFGRINLNLSNNYSIFLSH